MIRKFACAAAAALLTAFLAAPANAGHFKLGILSCDIGGGTGYVIASNKGLSCTFKPSGGGGSETYTGIVSKLGVDLGVTHQGALEWAVLALAATMTMASSPATILASTPKPASSTGGGANLLVGGFRRSFTLQPLSVQAQTGVNLAVAVTAMELIYSLK